MKICLGKLRVAESWKASMGANKSLNSGVEYFPLQQPDPW